MDKALFNRRFKWALQEGTLKPAWSDYQKDAEETQHMGGSALLAACRDRLERATGHLGLARMYSPEVRHSRFFCPFVPSAAPWAHYPLRS